MIYSLVWLSHASPEFHEFGVYAPYAPPTSRFRWMADVRKTTESHGFG